jgi:hypothetical protein
MAEIKLAKVETAAEYHAVVVYIRAHKRGKPKKPEHKKVRQQ